MPWLIRKHFDRAISGGCNVITTANKARQPSAYNITLSLVLRIGLYDSVGG
jgi:hypothetical protein